MSRPFYALVVVLWLLFAAAVLCPEVRRAKADDPLWGLRDCESRNDYAINTGNGYYGAYQFSLATWQGVGGAGYPHLASPEEQDARAWVLLTVYGSQHWPTCQFRLAPNLRRTR